MTDISDNFDSNTLANWSIFWSSGWLIDTGTTGKCSGPSTVDVTASGALVYGTAVDSADQWARVEFDNFDVGSSKRLGLILRSDGTNTGDCYFARMELDGTGVLIGRIYNSGQSTETLIFKTGVMPETATDGDTFAATVSGTSTGTEFNLWINPLGSIGSPPADWGDSDWSYTGIDSGSYVDTGDYVGLWASPASTTQLFDDFSAGATTSIPIFMNHYRQMRK